MTKLLDRGIAAVSALAPEQQDLAGELLLEMARSGKPSLALTSEQIADLKESVAEADRGEFASDDEVREAFRKFGR
jgi:predicted transcriptional regulator